jgi:hypothetical protein
MSATKKFDGRGRKPLSDLERATRRASAACAAFSEVDMEFKGYITPEDPKNPTDEESEILRIANRRLQLNVALNDVLKDTYSLLRKKRKTPEEKQVLENQVQKRDEIFEQLKLLPELGVSYAEWGGLSKAEKSKGLGRPKVSLELRYIRADIEYKESMAEYKEECARNNEPLKTIRQLIDYRNHIAASDGRPSGGVITELEKKLKLIYGKIEKIESGEADIEMVQKRASEIVTSNGKRMGRPFESSKDKMARHMQEAREIKAQIAEIESSMDPYELVQRKIVITRRNIKDQNETINHLNIDVESDKNHKEVKALRKLEAGLDTLISQRAELENGPVVAVAQQAPSESTASGISMDAIKEMAKNMQKAKLKAASESAVAQVNESQVSRVIDKNETNALKSILGKRKSA